ncbi:MAG TPA: outer membrane protein assembly factor BamD [Burkholderiales bacterium]
MRYSLALLLALFMTGCGMLPDMNDETKGWSASRLYAEARSELGGGNYEKAIKYYQKLESRFPYGRFAQQAQIEIAYAHYKDQEPALAIAAADRFIKLHPNHPNVDYLYYLKGLCNFNDDLGLLGYVSGQDMSERDPKAAREAFDAFKELATRFPKSKYTPDAVARMNYLVNALAGNEVHVARYYLKRGAYVAAVNRAQYALKTYPQAPANEEGLAVMMQAYDALGLTDLKKDTERILAQNFPDSRHMKQKDVAWWQIWNW